MNWKRNWSFKVGEIVESMKAGAKNRYPVAARFFTGMWAFLMLTVFPLYTKNRYYQMGQRKFAFFLWISISSLIPGAICAVLNLQDEKKPKTPAELLKNLGILDRTMLSYLAVSIASWYMSVDRIQAWTGADGWFMGLRTQLLLVLAYFLTSRYFPWNKIIFAGHFLASGAVFFLGIGHRFGIDPFGMYKGIDESYQLLFLSTIGQATWYSSYVCTVLTIGVTAFFLASKPIHRFALGFYCMLGFSTVVTQNSDSAFAAMAFLMFGLFLVACDSMDKIERFLETVLLMLGSFKLMGGLQRIFPDRAIKLDGISHFLSQSAATWLVFLAFCILYTAFLFYRVKNPDKQITKYGRPMRKTAAGIVIAAFLFYLLAAWMNTTGRLETWFGIRSTNQYLIFDQYWGNNRGLIWMITFENYKHFPFFRKMFGAGPDCFAAYCYGKPDVSIKLNQFWGWDQILANAHNEFLNTLFCMGIAGLLSFSSIFVAAFQRFYRERKKNPYMLAGMLAASAYAAHNFFCYQQVCCTPFLFLILGMAENLAREKNKVRNRNEITC